MQEEKKDSRPKRTAQQNSTAANDERLAEATSSETLTDVRADAKLANSDSTARDVSTTPAPDGSAATAPGSPERADGSNTGGPM